MAANIATLADATVRMKTRSDKSVGWPLAAIKAIEGTGIKHKPDVARLKTEVLAELGRRGEISPARSAHAHR